VFLLGVIGAGDWIPVNSADNVLHAVLTLGLLGAWAAARKEAEPRARVAT
jgi:hypothetical protein